MLLLWNMTQGPLLWPSFTNAASDLGCVAARGHLRKLYSGNDLLTALLPLQESSATKRAKLVHLRKHCNRACDSAAQPPWQVLWWYCVCQLQATRPVPTLDTLAAGADRGDAPLAEGDLVRLLAAGGASGLMAAPPARQAGHSDGKPGRVNLRRESVLKGWASGERWGRWRRGSARAG